MWGSVVLVTWLSLASGTQIVPGSKSRETLGPETRRVSNWASIFTVQKYGKPVVGFLLTRAFPSRATFDNQRVPELCATRRSKRAVTAVATPGSSTQLTPSMRRRGMEWADA